jgi:hypothetical protein
MRFVQPSFPDLTTRAKMHVDEAICLSFIKVDS